MKIIKLDAIDSTNSFLKDLAQQSDVENFTVVVTKEQFYGKGQIGSQWISQKGKNLTASLFTRFNAILISQQFYLNFAVSLAVFESLDTLHIPKLHIKWPNDIMSGAKKIGGILIENSTQKNQLVSTIIGLGINANQTKFPADLPKASSIKNCIQKEIDLDLLLENILNTMLFYLAQFQAQKFEYLKEQYLSKLYLKDIPATFKDVHQNYFMGIIKGVSETGKLQILLENDSIKEFGIKEVTFA